MLPFGFFNFKNGPVVIALGLLLLKETKTAPVSGSISMSSGRSKGVPPTILDDMRRRTSTCVWFLKRFLQSRRTSKIQGHPFTLSEISNIEGAF